MKIYTENAKKLALVCHDIEFLKKEKSPISWIKNIIEVGRSRLEMAVLDLRQKLSNTKEEKSNIFVKMEEQHLLSTIRQARLNNDLGGVESYNKQLVALKRDIAPRIDHKNSPIESRKKLSGMVDENIRSSANMVQTTEEIEKEQAALASLVKWSETAPKSTAETSKMLCKQYKQDLYYKMSAKETSPDMSKLYADKIMALQEIKWETDHQNHPVKSMADLMKMVDNHLPIFRKKVEVECKEMKEKFEKIKLSFKNILGSLYKNVKKAENYVQQTKSSETSLSTRPELTEMVSSVRRYAERATSLVKLTNPLYSVSIERNLERKSPWMAEFNFAEAESTHKKIQKYVEKQEQLLETINQQSL